MSAGCCPLRRSNYLINDTREFFQGRKGSTIEPSLCAKLLHEYGPKKSYLKGEDDAMNLFDRLNNVKEKKQAPKATPKINTPTPIPRGKKICSPMGECILLEENYPGKFCFPEKTALIKGNLKLLRGVGVVNEDKLKQQGFHSIDQLITHCRWGEAAKYIMELIAQCKIRELQSLGAKDWEILSFFRPEDIVFLDIESTGLWASQPLFLVGVLYLSNSGHLVAEQYFARHYREEKAVLEAVNRVLKKFKVIVTYNGKRFDLPYITGRAVAHRLFYHYDHFHVDLLYHARKHLKQHLPDCRLMTLEEYLLGFKREGDIPGYLIPETYHRFVKTSDTALVEPILEHNRLDLVAMARLFHLVDPCCAAPVKLAKEQAALTKSSK